MNDNNNFKIFYLLIYKKTMLLLKNDFIFIYKTNSLPTIAVQSYTQQTIALSTQHMSCGDKEFLSPASTASHRAISMVFMTNNTHWSLHDDDYTAILTGIPWYWPAQISFCMTPTLRPGHPWPLPHWPLLLPPHTNCPKPLQYNSYDRLPRLSPLHYIS